jgi:hypothetical protein
MVAFKFDEYLIVFVRGSERSATPMPGIVLKSPLKDLVPIKSSAGPCQDKGKGRAIEAMDKGKLERGQLSGMLPRLCIFLCFSLSFLL